MWIATEDGFYSAVAHKTNPTLVVVRARALQDAQWLADWAGGYLRGKGREEPAPAPEVLAYQGSDYPWRVILSREVWTEYLASAVAAIDYTNFKNRVTEKQGKARHDIYSRVWSVMLSLEKLPGAMKDHAKRAVPHPLGSARFGNWRQPTAPDRGLDGAGRPAPSFAFEDEDEGFKAFLTDDEMRNLGLDPDKHRDCTSYACVADADEPECP